MSLTISKEDILKELFNISVGKSASLLSEIIEKRIILNIPDLRILDINKNTEEIDQYIAKVIEGSLMVSSISFKNKLEGRASLLFPAEKMRSFINLCMHETIDIETYDTNFTDVDFDIIKEIGNIVLNSIIGEVGNYINIKFNYTIPEIKLINDINVSSILEEEGYTYILMLYINFKIEDTKIDGAIIINLTLKSLDELLNRITIIEEAL
ncbi:MAG: chemotaxis protein CheC [Clostridiaceae bacterium]